MFQQQQHTIAGQNKHRKTNLIKKVRTISRGITQHSRQINVVQCQVELCWKVRSSGFLKGQSTQQYFGRKCEVRIWFEIWFLWILANRFASLAPIPAKLCLTLKPFGVSIIVQKLNFGKFELRFCQVRPDRSSEFMSSTQH